MSEPKGPISVEMVRELATRIVLALYHCNLPQAEAEPGDVDAVVALINSALAPLISAERAAGMVEMREKCCESLKKYAIPVSIYHMAKLSEELSALPIPGESALRELVERAIEAACGAGMEREIAARIGIGAVNKPTPESAIADWLKGRRA